MVVVLGGPNRLLIESSLLDIYFNCGSIAMHCDHDDLGRRLSAGEELDLLGV